VLAHSSGGGTFNYDFQVTWEEPKGRTPGTAPVAGDPRTTHRETGEHCH
jgi:hypothetical protein